MTLTLRARSDSVTSTVSMLGEEGDSSGVVALGLTVMIGVPVVTAACTVKAPANTDWVATPSVFAGLHVDRVGDEAGTQLHGQVRGDLLGLRVRREQDDRGLHLLRHRHHGLDARQDQVVVDVGRIHVHDGGGPIGGEGVHRLVGAVADDHRDGVTEAAGDGEQLGGGLADGSVVVVDQDEDLAHGVLLKVSVDVWSDELLGREELDELDATVALVGDDLAVAARRTRGHLGDRRPGS